MQATRRHTGHTVTPSPTIPRAALLGSDLPGQRGDSTLPHVLPCRLGCELGLGRAGSGRAQACSLGLKRCTGAFYIMVGQPRGPRKCVHGRPGGRVAAWRLMETRGGAVRDWLQGTCLTCRGLLRHMLETRPSHTSPHRATHSLAFSSHTPDQLLQVLLFLPVTSSSSCCSFSLSLARYLTGSRSRRPLAPPAIVLPFCRWLV